MTGLVIELQRAALEPGSVTRLLRMAVVVAKKLQVDEFERWAFSELNGYDDSQKAPAYRVLQGALKCFNPYRGWIPIFFKNSSEADWLSTRTFQQSAGDLEAMQESKKATRAC